ncbi:MAG: TetR/AcrR family transcriptional regulator [Bacteroidetes bacterium]|nr:TetR/AcrR family transcriptional regulator [Bacteroidota bacterium]
MKKDTSTQRNKELSKQKLIEAVGNIIFREGFKGIGINAIAKEANLDKVLIYRYFGGLNGLLKAFAKQKDFYINISNRLHDEIEKVQKSELKSLIVEILITQLRELRKDRELQELMLWEMMEKNELTIAIAKEREEKGYELSSKLKTKMDLTNGETDAIMALLVSGIYYLVLRSKTVDMFNGVELNSEKGWQKIENAIKQIINSYFE